MKRPAAAAGAQRGTLKRRPASNVNRVGRVAAVALANRRGRAAGKAAVKKAQMKGVTLINRGAGTMPVGAPAPFGGTRYTILRDPKGSRVARVPPLRGQRGPDGALDFRDVPEFRPNLTPAQCIRAGIFGGCYFNPRGGKPGIFGREVDVDHREFPKEWFRGVPEDLYLSRRYNVATNLYRVKSGQDQAFWEAKGWIHERDRRGWFQWYCRFYQGRRSPDDARQIDRWAACASDRGRWRNQLCGRIYKEGGKFDDPEVAPVIRQTLLHWAYQLTKEDYEEWLARQK